MIESPNGCGCVSQVSEGGISGRHPIFDLPAVHCGPTTDAEFNRVRAALVPIGCWRVEDIRFEFDSSFITPGIKTELKHLAELVKEHPPTSKSHGKPGCPMSVFGHADPTGDDEYNKQLSGRRAEAIYALLTRRTEIWEKLFSQPFGRDQWGRRALERMLDFVSTENEEIPGSQNSAASTKVAEGQQQSGNGRSAALGQKTQEQVGQYERDVGKRKQLFLKCMEMLCGADLKLERGDFLAGGEDAGGKGDFQGCSEFNPVLIFSQQDQKKFEQDKDKTARNNANAPNRRVMVLIYRKGSRVDPSKWPCPRVNEGVAGCKKRFWSDGEKRRSNQAEEREFAKNKDTFACRFYHRLIERSPCEVVVISAKLATWEVAPVNSLAASDEGLPLGVEVPPDPNAIAADDPEASELR